MLFGRSRILTPMKEIYRIVSNKALENESGKASGPGSGQTITVAPTDSKAVCILHCVSFTEIE